jgi:hypothetical protein
MAWDTAFSANRLATAMATVAPVEAFGQTNRAGAPKLLPFKPT